MEPNIGDAILVWGDSLVDDAIEWVESGKYAHVAFYAGNGQVLEANSGRTIGYRSLEDYKGRYDIGRINDPNAKRYTAMFYARQQIGQGYGWKLVFLMFLKLVLHINKPYDKAYGEVCSNYFCNAWGYADIIITNNDKPTPQDIADSPAITIEKTTSEA